MKLLGQFLTLYFLLLFFLYQKILHSPKAPKAQKRNQAKAQNNAPKAPRAPKAQWHNQSKSTKRYKRTVSVWWSHYTNNSLSIHTNKN